MRFRFCGDGDCPDWVLAEIIATLSNIPEDKLESLASQVAHKITGRPIEENAIKSLTATIPDEGKSAIACLHYLLVSAARHNVAEAVFNEEIQQLGLPRPHAVAVCNVMTAHETEIRQRLIDDAFKINELSRIEYIPHKTRPECCKFKLLIGQELVDGLPQDTEHTVHMERAMVQSLVADLKELSAIADKYNFGGGNKEHV